MVMEDELRYFWRKNTNTCRGLSRIRLNRSLGSRGRHEIFISRHEASLEIRKRGEAATFLSLLRGLKVRFKSLVTVTKILLFLPFFLSLIFFENIWRFQSSLPFVFPRRVSKMLYQPLLCGSKATTQYTLFASVFSSGDHGGRSSLAGNPSGQTTGYLIYTYFDFCSNTMTTNVDLFLMDCSYLIQLMESIV